MLLSKRGLGLLFVKMSFIPFMLCALAFSAYGATIAIDLDLVTPGIQNTADLSVGTGQGVITGAAVLLGTVGDSVTTNIVNVNAVGSGAPPVAIIDETANQATVLTIGDVPNANPANVTTQLKSNRFRFSNISATPTLIDADGLVLFHFALPMLQLDQKAVGDTINLSYVSSEIDALAGVVINNIANTFGDNGVDPFLTEQGAVVTIVGAVEEPTATPTNTEVVEVPTATPTEVVQEPTPTPTNTEVEPTPTNTEVAPTPTETEIPPVCADAGYYVLTSFGQHIRVGNPLLVSGNVSSVNPVFADMEVGMSTPDGGGFPTLDLAVLNQSGVVTFIENPNSTPAQQFIFDASSSCGLAVDVVMSQDSNAFWVLTEGGSIYRAGDANVGGTSATAELGNDAANLCNMLPIPFGAMRDPSIGQPNDGATIRAVGLAVVQQNLAEMISKGGASVNAVPTGFVVLDSQGGSYLFDGNGVSIRGADFGGVYVPGGAPNGTGVLDRTTIYPFFQGRDIARDIELRTATSAANGLVIYDGWGGIHPVPVDVESPVRFLRNETAVGSGVPISTVGMPYLVTAFDDPTSVGVDEGQGALDVNSIFADIEFCSDGISEGVYTLDRFGGVFAFGSTRNTPDSTAPRFSGSPYFFPFQYAIDMEPVLTGVTPEPTPSDD